MTYEEGKQKFVQTWGTLGSTWGINRTMAQIHALLLISPRPLCGDEMMEELQISRGNANMNIRALVDWGLVRKEIIAGDRRDFYSAEKDTYRVMLQIMKERRRRELAPVVGALDELRAAPLERTAGASPDDVAEFTKMVGALSDFTHQADQMLDVMIRRDEHWFYGKLRKMLMK